MSAPTPAPGEDRPREGYYPDPSIPGYVRYWNGASWVPGTSRPAPSDGAPLAPPPGAAPVPPAPAPAAPAAAAAPVGPAASVEETGPHFFDEDPQPPADPHAARPEPASAWGADRALQSGFGDRDRRVFWGAAPGADPRVPPSRPAGPAPATGPATAPATGPAPGRAHTSGAGTGAGAAGPTAETAGDSSPGTFVLGRPVAPSAAEPASREPNAAAAPAAPDAHGDRGTVTFRPAPPRTGHPGAPAAPGPEDAGGPRPAAPAAPAPGPAPGPGFGAGRAAADRVAAQAPAAGPASGAAAPPQGPRQVVQAPAPGLPQQPAGAASPPGPASGPVTSGPGGGAASWAQQVHRLAGGAEGEQPAAPWKPPVDDPFQAAARRQAAARPAGLGKRLAARLVDTVVLAAVTSAAAVPLGLRAADHVNGKVDAARATGHTVTVWLLDGTTAVYLGIVLAVLLLGGILYEALPTARWGRTLGKRLLGIEVRDIEGLGAPSFGAALRRWLVYSVPGLLVVGAVGVLWCLFDRPWHQCWHDKAAHTFVAE
ncbi:RDD family protein [Streptomyces sp. MS06]|uniref:RDD family protein n=1 Tax=Streptomyces sp. MS06 TaxID=3385974 RepID=UPI0039A2F7E6